MSRPAALLALAGLAGTTLAQAEHAFEGYTYVGCVSGDPSGFPMVVDFFEPFTPEQCQDSCASTGMFAAVGGGCYCSVEGLGVVDFSTIDESLCSNVCINGDESQGYCGGPSSGAAEGQQVYNLYRQETLHTGTADCSEEPTIATDTFTPEPTITVTDSFTPEPTITVTDSFTPPACPGEDCPFTTPTDPLPLPSSTSVAGNFSASSTLPPPVPTAGSAKLGTSFAVVALGAAVLGFGML